ncbi:MAG: rhodanese-like domain-containing protein [Thermodesulfobacteriota bacterium]
MNRKTITSLALGMIIGLFLGYGEAFTESNTPELETRTQVIKNITPDEAHVLIEKNRNNPDFVILDVRTPEEFAEGHIEKAVNLNYYSETFRDDLNNLDKNKTYVTHCRSGSRSGKTLDLMKEIGFKEAYNMTDGIIGWKEKGFPTVE